MEYLKLPVVIPNVPIYTLYTFTKHRVVYEQKGTYFTGTLPI